MSTQDVDDLARVCRALDQGDPEQALVAALLALEPLGISVHPQAVETPWLELARGARTLALVASQPVNAHVKEALASLLGVALARAAEKDEQQEIRERMEMLSTASFEGLFIHIDGVVIDVNQRLAEIMRAPRERLLGPETLRTCVAPEDIPGVLQRMAAGYEGAYVITGIRNDGSRFRAELQSKQGKLGKRPVRVVAVRDVTERERTLALLRESEARLRDLADSVFDLTVLSREGIVVDVGGRIEGILGYTREQVVGRPIVDFVAASSVPETLEVLEKRRPGAYESLVVSATGELVPFEIIAVNSTFDGKPTRVAGLRDLRNARRLEQERRKLEQQVERSQRLNSLGVLAGGIAHDFNNLLVGMLGNADLLLGMEQDPDARELLQAIMKSAERAAALTSQMLAYAGRGKFAEPQAIDLAELLQEIRMLLSASLSKKAQLDFEIESGCVVLGDRTTLTQVLLNLLTNASDALASGSGHIEVRCCRIKEPDARWDDALGSTVRPGDWVQIEVEDTGVGMTPATLARVFEPFFSTKTRGHGLGLAACLGIVSAHQGALHVASTPGRGSCFSVLLPATHAAEERPVRSARLETAPCRVLVVDDEPVVRSQLRRSLELRGFTVTEASGGRSGLAALEQGNVDLMLLDMTMNDMDGADVVREVRRRGLSVPIVLTSGYVDAAAERRLDPGSFQAFLRKPYGIAELLDAVRRARSAAINLEARP